MKKRRVYAFVFAIVIVVSIIFVSSINLDLNHDGVVNITDLQILAAHFEGKATYNSTFDLNNDSRIDLFDVVKVARGINTSSGGVSVNLSGEPIPPSVGSSNIIFDARSGGINSIQAANITNVTQADSAFKAFVWSKNMAGPTVYPVDFVTNFDGNGTHAYRINWEYHGNYTGNSTCYNGNGEQDSFIDFNPSFGDTNATPIYFQWKTWMGRTVSGGGMGNSTVGSFDNSGPAGGHKILIIYRQSTGGTEYRTYFGYNGATNGLVWAFKSGWGDESVTGEKSQALMGLPPTNLNDYINQVVTWTLYIKPESAANASDGELAAWLDGKQFFDAKNIQTGNTGIYEHQLGGPTWICPPQDQTQYFWDFVEWKA